MSKEMIFELDLKEKRTWLCETGERLSTGGNSMARVHRKGICGRCNSRELDKLGLECGNYECHTQERGLNCPGQTSEPPGGLVKTGSWIHSQRSNSVGLG